LAAILGEEFTNADLIPIFDEFIKDLDEVRIGVLKHLAEFLKVCYFIIHISCTRLYHLWLTVSVLRININCSNVNHHNTLSKFCEDIYKCCFNAGCAAIPTFDQSMIHNGVGIAGWNEHIRPFREKSLFWHRLWIEADKPRHGALGDIKRSTRSKYHYKIRELRRNEYHIRKQAFDSRE